LITYIVKYNQFEKVFANIQVATKEAERIGEKGTNVYVYEEIDGVREEEPFFSCTWGL
jgi:hypothetical protein